jgi:copper(I)-binding protein
MRLRFNGRQECRPNRIAVAGIQCPKGAPFLASVPLFTTTLVIGMLCLLMSFGAVSAHDEGEIVITGVWARPTVGAGEGTAMGGHGGMSETPMAEGTPMSGHGNHAMGSTTPSAAYMQIANLGDHPIALVTVVSPVAMTVEIHQTTIVNDVASMGEVEGGIEIAPGESVSLQPGGFHLMLLDLMQDLAPGDAIALDLTFEMRERDAEPMVLTTAAIITDLPPMDLPLVTREAVAFEADGEMIPAALMDVALPEGLLVYARLENVSEADAPLASAMFMDEPALLSVLVDGELFEIDEYDVGVGETVEVVIALGDVMTDQITTGALPFSLLMSDDTLLPMAAALPGEHMHMHE